MKKVILLASGLLCSSLVFASDPAAIDSVAWKYIKGRKRITNGIEKRLPGECPDNRL